MGGPQRTTVAVTKHMPCRHNARKDTPGRGNSTCKGSEVETQGRWRDLKEGWGRLGRDTQSP